MTFDVRWPDGTSQSLYSPSLVVGDHLRVGASYPVADFVARTREAMRVADERVRARYGFGCAGATTTVADVERAAAGFTPTDAVVVTAFSR